MPALVSLFSLGKDLAFFTPRSPNIAMRGDQSSPAGNVLNQKEAEKPWEVLPTWYADVLRGNIIY